MTVKTTPAGTRGATPSAAGPNLVSRRALLAAPAALAGLTLANRAFAQAPEFTGAQAEWRQQFDDAARRRVARSSVPMLSPQSLSATEEAIARYRSVASAGGWPRMPDVQLKLGARGPAVVALRERLIAGNDLDAGAGTSQTYDSFVETAVRRFQIRHGLNPTGQVAQSTVRAMNVPAETRVRQLEINAVRLRSYAGDLGRRHILTNIPAALIETVEDGRVVSRHTAVVGKSDRQSPVMNARITEINFHPFWTVPASIIRKDLIPKMRVEPNYLTENRIRIYNGAGQELQPSQVNWNSDEATRYRFRQDSGDFNSMGTVRINIPNPHGVYMHDTNSKGLFGDEQRFHSSGCIRVQNVRDYVSWLLKETPGYDRARIDDHFANGQRHDAKLAQAVPVYWTYITAWATPDGVVQFRDDIYNRDGLGLPQFARGAAARPEAADAPRLDDPED